MDLMLASAVFALVFVMMLVFLSTSRQQVDESLARARRMLPDGAVQEEVDIVRRRPSADSGLRALLLKLNFFRLLENSLLQAGFMLGVGDLLILILVAFGAGTAGGWFFWHDRLYALATGLVIGWLPIGFVNLRRRRRIQAFSKQLPYALDLIKSSLEAGHSLNRALQVLVEQFTDPIRMEFRTVLEETRIGLPLPRALEDLLIRVPERDLRLLVIAVKVQTGVGSSLAQIVGRLSELVRARQQFRMQVYAMTAQQRLGGMIVFLLPMFVLAAFSITDPNYAKTLFYDPSGWMIVKTAATLDLFAFLIIRRLLRLSY